MHNDEPRMELRALLAVILSMAVLASYQYFFVPPPVEGPVPGELPPVESPVAATERPAPAPQAPLGETALDAARQATAGATEESQVTIIARNYRATITNRGGRIQSMVLPGYRDDEGQELDLVSPGARQADRLPLEWFGVTGGVAELNDALFDMTVEGGGFGGERTIGDGEEVTVSMIWADGSGRTAAKTVVFPGAGNQILVSAESTGFPELFLGLGAGLDQVPAGLRNAYLAENALVYGLNGLETWSAADLATPVAIEGPLWSGQESHYFLAAFLLDQVSFPPRAILSSVQVQQPAPPDAEDPAPVDHVVPASAASVAALGSPVPIYFGPKKYDYLVEQGHSLEQAIDFGLWGIVSRPLLFVLNTIYSFTANYGLAIILLTALLRLVFWPLNQKAMTSMRKTQKLQPQMAAIRGKYKGAKDMESRQKMNEEVMALYKREGVSPLGGCLPMLAQIPILFAFYALLSVAIELRQAPFALWVTDLSRHDPYLVLPLLMGASMFFQQRLTPQTAADPQQASMMRMMRFMPIFFTVMFLYVPSGLVLYWLSNNLLGIGQQLYVNRSMDRQIEAEKAAKKAEKAAKKAAKSQRGNK